MHKLATKITELEHIGPTLAKRFKKLGIVTVQDLIFYFPFRYDNFSSQKNINDLQAGENVNVVGFIDLIQNKRSFKRKLNITEALITDDSGAIKVIWFNQPFLTKSLKVGQQLSLSGKCTEKNGELILQSPSYERVRTGQVNINTQGLVPYYPSTADLSQKQIRSALRQVLPLVKEMPEWIPPHISQSLKLLPLAQALRKIHFPKNQLDIQQAQQRLGFAEMFIRQLRGQMIKTTVKSKQAIPVPFEEKLIQEFVKSLPFELTASQKKSAWEILQDLQKNSPMSRLLEGDVGSGKTIVAALAILNLAKNSDIFGQSALMAPTEILATQHYHSLQSILAGYDTKIALLTGHRKEANFPLENSSQKKIQEEILQKADIVIGTHALIQDKVKFRQLLLAIIDEQHRFGVKQRQQILSYSKTITPHFLSMTATPIPRSLALSIYGDLDISVINEMPRNRKKIISQIVPSNKKAESYAFIAKEIEAGRQAFVICPLIDESDKLELKSVKAEHEQLQKNIFPQFKVGLLHGKLKSDEKETIMQDFLDNKINILVSTSVIEVGIDIPNASVMLIEGASRFGLAQLHQFRGRIGRGEHQSYCFVSLEEGKDSERTKERLEVFANNHNGFKLAEYDLHFRGSGDLYGIQQSGFAELKIASLFDYALIKKAQEEAIKLITADPELKQHPLVKEKLKGWEKEVHLE